MRRVINVSKTPFELVFDAGHIMIDPGKMVELDDAMAAMARKQSVVWDEEGNPEAFRIEIVEQMTEQQLKNVLAYDCPMNLAGKCSSGPFRTLEDLKAHLDTHLNQGVPERASPRKQ